MSIITGKSIEDFRLFALIKACELEAIGLKRRGPSALSILKRELGVKGNRQKVLAWAKEVFAEMRDVS